MRLTLTCVHINLLDMYEHKYIRLNELYNNNLIPLSDGLISYLHNYLLFSQQRLSEIDFL